MYKLTVIAAVLIPVLWLGPITAAETDKIKVADELLVLTNAEKTAAEIRGQMAAMLAAQIRNTSVPDSMREKLVRFQQQITDIVFEELSFSNMRPLYAESYAATFTLDELNGLVAFFKTPLGRAYVEKIPMLSKQIIALAQKQMANAAPRIKTLRDEFVAELKQEAAKQ